MAPRRFPMQGDDTNVGSSGEAGADRNGNGVPDVLERTVTIREKFGRRGVMSDPKQAFRMDDPNLTNDQRAMGIAAVEDSRRAQERREQDQGATDANVASAGRQTGIFLGSRPTRFHLADLNSDMGALGSAEQRMAAAGRGSGAGVNRFKLMQSDAEARAESGRRFDSSLASAERQEDIKGRYNLMGEQARAAGQVGAALLGRREVAAQERDPLRTVGNRLIDTRTGTEIAPELKPSAQPEMRETEVKGVYWVTGSDGKTEVKDLRERISNGSYDQMRYYELQRQDPALAMEYLMGKGRFAPAGSGGQAPAGASAAAAAQTGGPVNVATQEEFDRLPAGAQFIFNGRRGTKR